MTSTDGPSSTPSRSTITTTEGPQTVPSKYFIGYSAEFISQTSNNLNCLNESVFKINLQIIMSSPQEMKKKTCKGVEMQQVPYQLKVANQTRVTADIKFQLSSNTVSNRVVAQCGNDIQDFIQQKLVNLLNDFNECLVTQTYLTGPGKLGWVCDSGYVLSPDETTCTKCTTCTTATVPPSTFTTATVPPSTFKTATVSPSTFTTATVPPSTFTTATVPPSTFTTATVPPSTAANVATTTDGATQQLTSTAPTDQTTTVLITTTSVLTDPVTTPPLSTTTTSSTDTTSSDTQTPSSTEEPSTTTVTSTAVSSSVTSPITVVSATSTTTVTSHVTTTLQPAGSSTQPPPPPPVVRSHLTLYYQAVLTGNQIGADQCTGVLQAAVNQSLANVHVGLPQELTKSKTCDKASVTSPIYMLYLNVTQGQINVISTFLLTSDQSTVQNTIIESCANGRVQKFIKEKLKNELESELQEISSTCAGVSLTEPPRFDRKEWECFDDYQIDITANFCTHCPDCKELTTTTTTTTSVALTTTSPQTATVQPLDNNRRKRSTYASYNNFLRKQPLSFASSYKDIKGKRPTLISPDDSLRRKRLTQDSKSVMVSHNYARSKRPALFLYNKRRRQRFDHVADNRQKNNWRRKWTVLSENLARIRSNVEPQRAVNMERSRRNIESRRAIDMMRIQRNMELHRAVNMMRSQRNVEPHPAVITERIRRNVEPHPAVDMVWSAAFPMCRDTEKPTFRDCPKSPVFVSLPPGGPVPVDITVPSAYDNSNSSVTMTYSPSDFRTPYLFRKNTTVIITARDTSNNEARCNFQVILIDTFPPTIECPMSVVIEKYDTNQTTVPIRYHGNYITAIGDSGIAQYTYRPQEGTYISIRTHVQVMVTVHDNQGNTASCNFTYEAQRNESFPIYQLDFSVNLSPASSHSSVCDVSSLMKINISNIIKDDCYTKFPQMFSIEVKSLLIDQEVVNITAQIWRQSPSVEVTPEAMSVCAKYATKALNTLNNVVLQLTSCEEVALSYSSKTLQQGFTCPNYSVLTPAKYCRQCVLGTFPNTSQCEPCPKVSNDRPARHPYCQICSLDTQEDSHCLAVCKPGEYSSTGLQPCIKCAKGNYSTDNASISCTECPGMSTSTVNIGSSSPSDCKEECPMGAYSLTGLKPCVHCPYHFYSDHTRSTSCTECPRGKGTTSPGGASQTLCKVLNPCLSKVCLNDGTCTMLDEGRFHQCSCLSGFTGERCENHINVCQSYPCMNGATCQASNSSNNCICRPGYTGLYCETDINDCESNPCVHGNCIDRLGGFSCACYPGYKGLSCDSPLNECASQPCMNNGTCVDKIGEYRCYCNGTGFQGTRCNTKVMDCLDNTCLNMGVCHDYRNEFKCSCLPDFTGSQCEEAVDKCVSRPCLNQALCLDGVNNYSCICQRGYTGTHCEIDIKECQSNSCRNGGTCKDGIDDFECTCARGYAGKSCAVNIEDCLSSPCRDNNTVKCEDLVDGFLCVCKPGWTGVNCETLLEECTSHPCQNGATCRDIDVDYICSCPTGYTGLDCQVDVDDCASGPCYNGGNCTDRVNSYTCTCLQGFTGAKCEDLLDQCSSSPCHNSGTCVSLLGNYRCRCKHGWTGLNCENEVDDCLSMPCHNGGTCQDQFLGYNCTCAHDYTGPQCDVAMDPCDFLSCENGGSCVIEGGHVMCVCAPTYTGQVCEALIDKCKVNNPCQNDAICSSSGCQCQPLYTGKHCDKLMTKDFDLMFPGQSGSLVKSPVMSLQQTSQFSVCLWVHFRNQTVNMTFLSLHSEGESETKELLAMLGGKLILSFSSTISVNWTVHDKLWHHAALTWSDSGHWSVYVDGQIINGGTTYNEQVAMPNKQFIVLGQRSAYPTAHNLFEGEISQVNVYSKALSQMTIQAMANNCTTSQVLGDQHQWPEFSSYIHGNVSVIMPTICGVSTCPPGLKGPRCDKLIDKNPPVVHNCTDDIMIVTDQRLNKVDWQEPSFSDDVGVNNITKTHRPGITLSYGQYTVHYTAFDEEKNFAICSFDIFIKPWSCVMPASPNSVQVEWSTWEEGLSFQISCLDSNIQDFPVPTPNWFTCGKEGFWDPPQGTDFTIPSCAGVTSASGSLSGEIKFLGPVCTEEAVLSLQQDTLAVFQELYQPLCPSSGCSTASIQVDCGGFDVKRRKRQADTTYSVLFELPVNGSSLGSSGNAGTLRFETMVKEGSFDMADFILDKNNASIRSAIQCKEPGQILTPANLCVNCAVGTYKNDNTCVLCAIGEFSDSERQTSCQRCPPGTTTQTRGSTHRTHCFTLCSTGEFYDKGIDGCGTCSLGYYQDEVGQFSCKSCPNGQMTTDRGADSASLCTDACDVGEELTVSGTCVLCQKGTYRDSVDLLACVPCPYGYTTLRSGAVSRLNCSVVECPAGQYRNDTNSCVICQRGTFQPETGQSSCLKCGKGMTTIHPGSTSGSQCISGSVDECKLHLDDCHQDATCVDLPDLYRCECRTGFSGNSTYCRDNCQDMCGGHGQCRKDEDGTAFCVCNSGYTGNNCQTTEGRFFTTTSISGIGASLALFVAAVVIILCVLKSRRQAHSKENNYQDMSNRVHREDETVVYPKNQIPVRFNPSYCGDSDDPTHPVRSSPSIDLESPWSLYRPGDEPELWRNPSLSSDSSQESQIPQTHFNLHNSANGHFDISESYF
ncbi:uncharacterized protein LOC110444201 isoform X4 [Mizuhopecten yessoensis]|uniref:uncharacterized protein LOC110444201 isoform X4 n=1 Tax=Mizuhopecten yessoensis TaxID=6573 RepID=UPI000B45C533|nr:uncharacterized protein LOC110444201 isoform X4 [Mizuhopecten yessoensis]